MKVQFVSDPTLANSTKAVVEMSLHEARVLAKFLGIHSASDIERMLKLHHGGMTQQAKEEYDEMWDVLLSGLWAQLRRKLQSLAAQERILEERTG